MMKFYPSKMVWLALAAITLAGTACTKYTIENRCCTNEYEITNTKYVLPDSFGLWIPQAFTPNGDGLNDYFLPYGTNFKVENFVIKKGRKVMYESDDFLEAFWDGYNNKDGEEAEDGRYTYEMVLRLSNRERLDIKGDVCVMRFGQVGDRLYESQREQVCNCLMGDMIDVRDGIVSETPECPTNGYTD